MNKEELSTNSKKIKLLIAGVAIIFVFVASLIYVQMFGAPQKLMGPSIFVSPPPFDGLGGVSIEGYGVPHLKAEGFIKSQFGFKMIFALIGGHEIQTGPYQLSRSMTAWEVAKILKTGPNLKSVIIPEGLRKEQIADLLGKQFNWSDDDKKKWITIYTALNMDYLEGVYFPDTYLIPIDEKPIDIAKRIQKNFDEKIAPYSKEAIKKKIKWTTVINLASLVQREATKKDDMPLVAGIFWNRFNKDMNLEVDATLQYARDSIVHYGKEPGNYQSTNYITEGGWWTPIKVADKQINTPFNTYMYKGLPPRPICNPGTDAIKAVLNSAKTECLYYIYDGSKTIHCAKTFSEHQENIKKYLQ